MKVALFLMTEKGAASLDAILESAGAESIAYVIGSCDGNVRNDYFDEIQAACTRAGVPFYDRASAPDVAADYALAISWRWMIQGVANLITLHDSILPRYRGFAPLPNALINGEAEVGVTAIFASGEYDSGDIISQRRVAIEYPITIQQAIERIAPLYGELAAEICTTLRVGKALGREKQDEAKATYSLWRDGFDYEINWLWEAARIARFIDAVGYPYLGATTLLDGEKVTVLAASAEADVRIENRSPGKVIFMRDGDPVVVCGSGLLRIRKMASPDGSPLLPLKKFRSRFGAVRLSE